MPVLETRRLSDDVVVFNTEQCIAAGDALHGRYATAVPFPHIALTDFIDAGVLRDLVAEWPDTAGRDFYDRAQERLKYEFQPVHVQSPKLRSFLAEMNGEPMLRFIEHLTGIPKLIADPYYSGGGLHETKRGGHLGVHADFNIHRGMNLLRRINLLIYLNPDWPEEYGGNLELWSRDMRQREVSVAPVLGNAVIFNTDLDSFHGVPEPVACPPDRARRSLALYYYTAPESGLADVVPRTTTFQVRPSSKDRKDWPVLARHMMQDWLPPAVYRALKRPAK